jgi:hypothetical protein
MKKNKNKSKQKSKRNMVSIGQYKVSKNKKTKYIELYASDKAPKEVRVLVKKLISLLGSKILYVNIFDDEFREQYNIQSFVKGSIRVDLDEMKDHDNDEDSDDDRDEDEDSDDENEDSDDENEDSDDDEDSVDDSDDDEFNF